MDIDNVYEAIAAGTARDPDLSWTRRRLQAMALSKAKEGTEAERLGALRVAAVLGPRDGIPIVAELVRDADEKVRAWALSQAIGARELGIPVLRTALEGPDPEHVSVALDHLQRWVDSGCVPALRRLLVSSHPGVRSRAAQLLGNSGGNSVRGDLLRLAQDPSDEVRAAAEGALATLAGDRPRATRDPWWDEVTEPPPAAVEAPVPVPPTLGEGGVGSALTVGPPPEDPDAPPTWGADAKRWGAGPVVRGPKTSEATDDAPGWDGHPIPLPPTLPDETRALVKLLGMVADSDREVVLARFRAADAKRRRDEFGSLILAYSGSDVALGCGICVLAGAVGGVGHVAGLRPLVRHGSPLVRAAALRALGALAPPAAVPWIAPLLDDADARDAAVESLVGIGRRARADLARDVLRRVTTDDDGFRARVDDALRELSA